MKKYTGAAMLVQMPSVNTHDAVHPMRYSNQYDLAWDQTTHRFDFMIAKTTRRAPKTGKVKQFTVSFTAESLTAESVGATLIHLGKRLKKFHRTGK